MLQTRAHSNCPALLQSNQTEVAVRGKQKYLLHRITTHEKETALAAKSHGSEMQAGITYKIQRLARANRVGYIETITMQTDMNCGQQTTRLTCAPCAA